MKRVLFTIIILLATLTPLSTAAHAGPIGRGLYERITPEKDSLGTDRLQLDDQTVASRTQTLVTWLTSLPFIGSVAWPSVRTYIWETTFKGNPLFLGYAESFPGREDAEHVRFQLMVDEQSWRELESHHQRETLSRSRQLVADRLAAIDLQGSFEIMLVSQ